MRRRPDTVCLMDLVLLGDFYLRCLCPSFWHFVPARNICAGPAAAETESLGQGDGQSRLADRVRWKSDVESVAKEEYEKAFPHAGNAAYHPGHEYIFWLLIWVSVHALRQVFPLR